MRQHPIRTGVRFAAPVVACALAICITVLPWGGGGVRSADARHNLNLNQVAGLSESDLFYGLTAAGLTPEALTAAGVDDEGTTALVAAGASYLGNSPSALPTAVTDLGEATAEVDRLERLARRGGVVEPEALADARSDRDAAQSTLDALLAALRTTAMTPLSNPQRATLNAIKPNLGRNVPVEFKVTERSESDWTVLRDALSNEAQAGCGVTTEDQACAAFLETARDEDVQAAQTNLAANLGDVITAFHSAVETLGE